MCKTRFASIFPPLLEWVTGLGAGVGGRAGLASLPGEETAGAAAQAGPMRPAHEGGIRQQRPGRYRQLERGQNRGPQKVEWSLYSVNKTLLDSM